MDKCERGLSGELAYVKPAVKFWTPDELNRIEAKMSGGGGGGGGINRTKVASAPAPYQWFKNGTKRSSTAIDLNNRALAVSIVVSILTAGLNAYVGTAISIAGAIVSTYISNNAETLYYNQTYYEICINASSNTPYSPIWHPLGNATYTCFYTDSGRSILAGDELLSDLDDDYRYLLSYLRNYLGL